MDKKAVEEINELMDAFGKCVDVFLKRHEMDEVPDSPNMKILQAFEAMYQGITEQGSPYVKTRAAVVFAEKLAALPETSFIGVAPLVLGALIESGGHADEVAPIFTKYLKNFTNYFLTLPKPDDESEVPEEIQPWMELAGYVGQASAAIYSRAKAALLDAQKDKELMRKVIKMRWEARFLHHIMVLPHEMSVYIFCMVGTKFGCKARISGISDNVQLNVLMEDAFAHANRADCTPVNATVKSVFDGTGPQQTQLTFSPKFQLSTWANLQSDLDVPPALGGMKHWIWGEGVPDDIMPCPALDGARVILLGETAIHRSNNVCREFGSVVASFSVEKYFDGGECTALLQSIANIDPKIREEMLAGERERTNVASIGN